MSEPLTITKEAVLRAAEKCSTAKDVLKELFPEAFKDDRYFDLRPLSCGYSNTRLFSHEQAVAAGFKDSHFMMVRSGGEYEYKAFYLSDEHNWELKEDSVHNLCLIPTRK